MYLPFVLTIIAAYLCGSIPFGKLIAASRGIDIQRRGSGNIGFANVRRVLGWRAGLLTLAGDILKGFVPVLVALIVIDRNTAYVVGLMAIIGHLYPVWLKFRGGKGIATGFGMMLVLQPWAAVLGGLLYVVGCLTLRNSSQASLIGVFGLVTVAISLDVAHWLQYAVLAGVALYTLRKNILGTVPDYDASAVN